MRIDFDWDPAKAASNAAKHGVTFEQAMSVFRDPLAGSILDRDSDPLEERWLTMGEASTGNLLVVVYTWKEIGPDRIAIRIISARLSTRNESRQYRENSMP